VAHGREVRYACTHLVGKSERKTGYRWEDNIKMKLTEVEWHTVDWMHLSEYQEK